MNLLGYNVVLFRLEREGENSGYVLPSAAAIRFSSQLFYWHPILRSPLQNSESQKSSQKDALTDELIFFSMPLHTLLGIDNEQLGFKL